MRPTKLRPPGILVTISAVAPELGASREAIRSRLVEAGIAPVQIEGRVERYRLRAILNAWYAPAASDPARLNAFARRAFFQAQHQEMRNMKEAGELIPADEVQRDYAVTFSVIAQGLGTFADQCELRGLPASGVAIAEEVVTRLRREMAARLRQEPTPIA